MQTRAKSFNPQVFLEFLSYCAFAILMLYLISSGKYLSYVTPRMKPYILFSAIVMCIWALFSIGRLFRPQHRVRSMHCFVLVIPILLLLLPHTPLGVPDLSSAYVSGNALPNQADQGGEPQSQFSADDSVLSGLDTANKRITVSNDDFGLWLSEIYKNMDQYEGYTVVMTGFVFKDAEMLGEDTFVPARLMMSCCVADLVPAGLFCQYDKVPELENDAWVTIEGTLFIGEYEYFGEVYDDPQIMVSKITPAEVVEGYIYPY